MASVKEDDRLGDLRAALKRVEKDATAWRDACDAISDCFGAVGTIIMSLEPAFRGLWLFQSKVLEPVTEAYIAEGWQFKDLRQGLVPKAIAEGFASDDDLGDRRSLMKLPYFYDFLGSRGLGFGGIIAVNVGGKHFAVSMQFHADRAPFTDAEKKLALDIRTLVSETANRIVDAAQSDLDSLVGMMAQSVDELAVFDVLGQMTFNSQTPIEDFVDNEWPMVDIRSACDADARRFRPTHLSHERDGVVRQYSILQLPSSLRHFFTENKTIVLVTASVSTADGRRNRLKALYQLTDAELTCTELLAAGNAPIEIANQLDLKVSTIRQRLKGILQKTETSSQAKLVSLYFMQ
ncbi:MAG: helix-turn-helix transcriptional regulator [Paracoccaceae bacterium]